MQEIELPNNKVTFTLNSGHATELVEQTWLPADLSWLELKIKDQQIESATINVEGLKKVLAGSESKQSKLIFDLIKMELAQKSLRSADEMIGEVTQMNETQLEQRRQLISRMMERVSTRVEGLVEIANSLMQLKPEMSQLASSGFDGSKTIEEIKTLLEDQAKLAESLKKNLLRLKNKQLDHYNQAWRDLDRLLAAVTGRSFLTT